MKQRFLCLLLTLLLALLCACAAPETAKPEPPVPVPSEAEAEAAVPPSLIPAMPKTEDLQHLFTMLELGNDGGHNFIFREASQLSSRVLYRVFSLLISEEEADACWSEEEKHYIFPKSVIEGVLGRYFRDYAFDITVLPLYVEIQQAVVTPVVNGYGGGVHCRIRRSEPKGELLTVYCDTLSPEEDHILNSKIYILELYDGGYYFRSVIPTSQNTVILTPGDTQYLFNDIPSSLSLAPFEEKSNVYVPGPEICADLDCQYTYEDGTVTLRYFAPGPGTCVKMERDDGSVTYLRDFMIQIKPGENTYVLTNVYDDGGQVSSPHYLYAPVVLRDGEVFLPVRLLEENRICFSGWNTENQLMLTRDQASLDAFAVKIEASLRGLPLPEETKAMVVARMSEAEPTADYCSEGAPEVTEKDRLVYNLLHAEFGPKLLEWVDEDVLRALLFELYYGTDTEVNASMTHAQVVLYSRQETASMLFEVKNAVQTAMLEFFRNDAIAQVYLQQDRWVLDWDEGSVYTLTSGRLNGNIYVAGMDVEGYKTLARQNLEALAQDDSVPEEVRRRFVDHALLDIQYGMELAGKYGWAKWIWHQLEDGTWWLELWSFNAVDAVERPDHLYDQLFFYEANNMLNYCSATPDHP